MHDVRVDRRTVEVYEQRATDWIARRRPTDADAAAALAVRVAPGAWRVDLGCGPAWHSEHLGEPLVAFDAAFAMLRQARVVAPSAICVQGDLEALPFRSEVLGGAWAKASYLHIPAERLPLALADLHRALALGSPIDLTVHTGSRPREWTDEFAGRFFAAWDPEAIGDVVTGAGFSVDDVSVTAGTRAEWVSIKATRLRSLADTVGPAMRLLVVGLNPSEYASDAGTAFARPGNRFWPAALAAGLVTRDRDPRHALVAHGIGLTDLSKRVTPRAHWLTDTDYRAGVPRVERLVRWLQPGAVCFAGLAGYRAAVVPRAAAGWQPQPFGGRPAYLMPSPSGANGHSTRAALVEHLRTAAAAPPLWVEMGRNRGPLPRK